MNFLKNNKRGYTLVEVIVAVTLITTLVASYVNLFNGMLTSTTYFRDNMTAQMLAANKWKELDLVAYASLVAEAKATVGSTGFDREVILGADIDLGSGNHKRDVTINVYKTGSPTVLYTAPKTVTSAGTGSTGSPHGKQLFASSGTFTVPTGVTKVWLTGCAGGGGSGNRYDGSDGYVHIGYPGGGGEGKMAYQVTVTSGEVITVTVGAGGAGGAAVVADRNGSKGGNTSFGSYLTLNGGGGGTFTNPGAAGGPGGGTGSRILNFYNGTYGVPGAMGGGSMFGAGITNSVDATGVTSSGYGSGGGGWIYGSPGAGIAGQPGFLLVEW